MATLRTLRIKKYLDVEPTTLTFHPKRNLLLGVNGGGKTTLLNLIAMVLNLDFRKLAQAPFAIGFLLEQEGWAMDVEIENEVSELPEGVVVREKSFTATVLIEFHNFITNVRSLFKTDGQKAHVSLPLNMRHIPYEWRLPALSAGSFAAAIKISVKQDIGLNSILRFDEGVDFLRIIHGDAGTQFLIFYDPSDAQRKLYGPAPDVLNKELCKNGLQLGERLSFDSDQEEFLKTLVEATGFGKVKLTADLIERSTPDSAGAFHERFKLTLFCARQDGREFIQNDLSFGQKRLWAFLYYLECNPHSVVADELVNGLHHRWIKLCVERIGDRQAFLTSQNPLLFDFIPLGTPAEPRCKFLRCDLDGPKMRWRNLEEDETTRLYDAYEAGIESVGEIFQTRGLW